MAGSNFDANYPIARLTVESFSRLMREILEEFHQKKKAEVVKPQPDCGCIKGCKAWDCPRV